MHSVFTMAIKDLTLMRRDWLGMFFIIGFPVLMGIFFGMIIGSFSSGGRASLDVAVVDKDRSEMSDKFVASLKSSEDVELHALDEQKAMEQVRRGKLVGVIIIPEGFGESAGIFWAQDRPAIQIGVDPSRLAEAGMLNGLVMQASGELMAARFQDPAGMQPFIDMARQEFDANEDVPPEFRPLLGAMFGTLDDFVEALEKEQEEAQQENGEEGAGGMPAMEFAKIERIDATRKPAEGSTAALVQKVRSKWDISFPQSMMWGVLGCTAAFAVTMVRERTQGTFLRLQVAPVTRGHVFAGKATACAASALSVIVFMVILGILLGMRPRSPGLLALAAICIAYCFVGVMMLMSVIAKSEAAVSGAAWGANIIMAMFGGGMIPLAFMPGFMKTISHASPVKWSILALEGAIWREFTFVEMLPPCAVLVGVGTVCLVIGVLALSRAMR